MSKHEKINKLEDGNYYILGGRENMIVDGNGVRNYVGGMYQQYDIDEPKSDQETLEWLSANHFTIKDMPLIQTGRMLAEVIYAFANADLSKDTMDEEGYEIEYGDGYISAIVEVANLPSIEELIEKAKDKGLKDGREMDVFKHHLSLILGSDEKNVLVYFDDNASIGHHTFALNDKDGREDKAYIAGIEVTKELQRPLSADDAPYWVSQHESLLKAFLEGAEYKLSQAN